MKEIERQVKATRDGEFNGFSFFFYETLGNRDAAFQSLLATPVTRPDKLVPIPEQTHTNSRR
jgi:uncharacterized protein YbaA (DUF1428 family)